MQFNSVTQATSALNKKSQNESHILIFELGYSGHYPHYIRHLTKFWTEHDYDGKLTVVVSPQFAKYHADVLQIGKKSQSLRLNFEILPEKDAACLIPRSSPFNRARRSLQEWSLLRRYTQKLRITHSLLLYFDSFQAAIFLRQPLSCSFSGIYFRPTSHYSAFDDYLPTRKETLQSLRERLVLPLVLSHPQLQHLFCLDPFFVNYAHENLRFRSALYLPDPVEVTPAPPKSEIVCFKQRLGIDCDRTTFLLFGALYDQRKGTNQVLDAIAQLPVSFCKKFCLLLVGQLGEHQAEALKKRIDQLTQTMPVQIIIRDGFVPDDEVALCFQVTDWVLAPYQRHVGMSGILVHAAAAQKPLIASDYGLLGEMVRQYQLGVTVDSTQPGAIAKVIQQSLQGNFDKIGGRQKMLTFAQQNSAESFSELIFQTLRHHTAATTES